MTEVYCAIEQMIICHETPDIGSDIDVVSKCGDEGHAECESVEQASVFGGKVVSGFDSGVEPIGNDEGYGSADGDYAPSTGAADIPADVGSSFVFVPGQMLPQGASDAASLGDSDYAPSSGDADIPADVLPQRASDAASPGGSDYAPSIGDADIPVDVGSPFASVPGQVLSQGASDSASPEEQLRSLLSKQDYGLDIHISALVRRVLSSAPLDELESVALMLFNSLVDEGALERLSDDIYRRVPPVPKRGHLRRRGNRLGSMRQQGNKGAFAEKVQGAYVKDKSKLRDGVGDKEDLEEKFSKFFQDLVSTWNPCYSKDGVCRFDWDAEVEAHDVEVDAAGMTDLPSEGDGLHRWPERVRLSKVLEETFRTNDGTSDREQVDVQPLRRLVAALVQTSARHDLHGKDKPVIGVHACARGKPGCAKCRYGFPIKELRPRLGGCDCLLVKGDREGQWHLRTPRNDELCCSYEDHVLLANLGNIDWRPCLNLWAVVQYISKYATKAPKGSRRIAEVLSDAVDDVCRFVPKEQDFLRRSIQRFFARTLGERDYHVYEAVHVGLGLPLVVPLLPVVTLNTSGARALKPRFALKDAPPDTPVHYDSKLDKFDQRREIFSRQYSQNPEELRKVLEAVKHVSLYEFWWKFAFYRSRFVKIESTSAIMVTPSYGADCANVQHSAHAGYAKACVIAYWRLMPTKERHDLYKTQRIAPVTESSVGDLILGGTEFVDPFHVAGIDDKDRLEYCP